MIFKKRRSTQREMLAAHLPFLSTFYIRNDLTIFRLYEKDFQNKVIRAHVLNHAELVKTISFTEVVYQLNSYDLSIVELLIDGYNN